MVQSDPVIIDLTLLQTMDMTMVQSDPVIIDLTNNGHDYGSK